MKQRRLSGTEQHEKDLKDWKFSEILFAHQLSRLPNFKAY